MEFDAKAYLTEYLADPSHDKLNRLRKDQILMLCAELEIPSKSNERKKGLLEKLIDHFVKEGILIRPEIQQPTARVSEETAATTLDIRKFELELKYKLEAEKEKAKLEAEKERAKLEAEKELEEKRMTIEREIQIKKLQVDREVELQKLKNAQPEPESLNSELLKTKAFVPKFSEKAVEQFFASFERAAQMFNWPKDKWPMLVQTELTGKAQRAYLNLSDEDASEYQKIKDSVLKSYECLPEYYRQKFRHWKRGNHQTHAEFFNEKKQFFERWCQSENVENLDDLSQLILLEECKTGVSPQIKIHLDEKAPKNLDEAAKLADSFELTHKAKFVSNTKKPVGNNSGNPMPQTKTVEQDDGAEASAAFKPESKAPDSKKKFFCSYCKKENHTISKCWKLHGKPNSSESNQKATPIGACSVDQGDSGNINSGITRPKEFIERENKMRREGERKFRSVGHLSTQANFVDAKCVQIWRDTGSQQSLMRKGILNLNQDTYLGSDILVEGVTGSVSVPLHKVFLESELVNGEIHIGLIDRIPMPGIDVLIGNEIAGSKVDFTRNKVENPQTDAGSPEPKEFQPGKEKRDEHIDLHALGKCESEPQPNDLFLEQSPEPPEISCVTTRAAAKAKAAKDSLEAEQTSENCNEEEEKKTSDLPLDRVALIQAQEKDPKIQELISSIDPSDQKTDNVYYYLQNGILMRHWKPPDATEDENYRTVHQIVLPPEFRTQILELAHECPLAGHLGVNKTLTKIKRHYFWLGMYRDVANFCRTCHSCQVAGKQQCDPPKAPLKPIPAVQEPFEKLICDCVGPLPRSKSGHQYLFTILCAATRFPAAFPLRNITAKSICNVLIEFFTTFGLPKVIQTDQGSNFMSKIFKQLSSVLGIKHICSSAYHPESQGALERYHQSLKAMLRTYCDANKQDWSTGVPLLLFATRESTQDSLGFSPFQLIFAHEPRGPLKLVKEQLMSDDSSEPPNLLDYVSNFKEKLHEARELAKENLQRAQAKMKSLFDTKTQERSFEVGQKVLVFLPLQHDPLKAKYFGPYKILKKINDVNYVLDTPDRRKKNRLCHINMLKEYFEREESPQPLPVMSTVQSEEDRKIEHSEITGPKLKNSEILKDLDKFLDHLEDRQKESVKKVIENSSKIFGDHPTVTDWIQHDIELIPGAKPIKQRPYRINPVKQKVMEAELDYMASHGIIEDSTSSWASPSLLVPKPDGTSRFVTDFRKLNDQTVPDNYPLPRISDCVEKIGQSKFISKIDLLKGYYQISLTPEAKKISAFVTPQGFYQYNVLAFGLRNAPSTFQRLANRIVQGIPGSAVYLDDLVVFSETWEDHMKILTALFERLQQANLTVNLAKSEIGKATLNSAAERKNHVTDKNEILQESEKRVCSYQIFPLMKLRMLSILEER